MKCILQNKRTEAFEESRRTFFDKYVLVAVTYAIVVRDDRRHNSSHVDVVNYRSRSLNAEPTKTTIRN